MSAHADAFLQSPLGTLLTAEQLEQQLIGLPDWEDCYNAVIVLGRSIPALPDTEKSEGSLLHGCQATVWVAHYLDPKTDRLYFLCDSDSQIVKGLLGCLLCIYSGQKPADILRIDAKPWMEKVGFLQHIASTRSNGIWAMISKIKAVASRY